MGERNLEADRTQKVLIILTHGLDTPWRIPTPFYYATTAAAMDLEATVYLTIKGATVVRQGEAEKVAAKEGGVPIQTFIDQALKAGVRVMVCQASLELSGIKPQEILEGVEIAGAATLWDLALDASVVLTF